MKADTINSTVMIKADAITATDTIRAKEDVIAEQDVRIAGKLDVTGNLNVKTKMVVGASPTSGVTMQYVPGTSNYPSLFKFSAPGGTGILNGGNGGTIAPEDSQPNLTCINGPIPAIANAFSQMLSVAFNPTNTSITGGQVLIGHNGVNAFFDTQGTGALSNPANNHPGDLFINGFCNRNVLFFSHSTPFGANATNIVSIDGGLNVRQRMQLGYNSATNFVEPNHKLYVLNDVGAGGEAIKVKNGSSIGAGLRIATYNNAKGISITQNSQFNGDGAETFIVEGDGKTTIKTNNLNAINILNSTSNPVWQVYNDGKTEIRSTNSSAFNILNTSGNSSFLINNDGKTEVRSTNSIAINVINSFGNNAFTINSDGKTEIKTANNEPFKIINAGNSTVFQVNNNGQTSIGGAMATSSSYMLTVNGKIGAREVRVTLNNPWPDYVFHKNYKLLSLKELEKYITKNKHLPGIPKASDLNDQECGLDVGKMQSLQMEKIEEIYLHLIELNKQIEELKKENELLKKQKLK